MMAFRMTRRMRWIGLLGAGVLITWWMWRPTPVEVQAGVIDEGPVRVTIRDVGTTALPMTVAIHAPSTGRWAPAAHRAGEPIRKGALLGVLYPPPLDAAARLGAEATARAAAAARDALVDQRAALVAVVGESERERQRAERLAEGGAVAPQVVEQARVLELSRRADLAALDARIRAATFDRDAAQAVVRRAGNTGLVVRAPHAGILLYRGFEHEQVVPVGVLLASVGDAAAVEIRIPLLTSDAMRVQEGDSVLVDFSDGAQQRDDDSTSSNAPLWATVRRKESTAFTKVSALGVEEQRVYVIAELTATAIPPTMAIGADFRAAVHIVVWSRPSVRRIPVSALVRDGARWSVWRIRDGKARSVDIQLGPIADDVAMVESELAVGDSVVLYPTEQIAGGVRVTTRSRRSRAQRR